FEQVSIICLCESISFEGGSVNFYGARSTSKFHNQLQGVSLELDAGRSSLRGCRSTFCVNRSTLKVDQSTFTEFDRLVQQKNPNQKLRFLLIPSTQTSDFHAYQSIDQIAQVGGPIVKADALPLLRP